MKLQQPQFPAMLAAPDCDPAELFFRAAQSEEELEGLHICNGFFPGTDISGQRFRGMIFEGCRFPGSSLRRASFVDVRFLNCDLSNCQLEEAYFNRCECISCKWVGAVLEGCTLRDVKAASVNLQYCNLDHSLFDHVLFENCDLGHAFLTQCRPKKLELEGCRMVQTSVHRTPLQGINLSSCELSGLVVSENFLELKGAVVRADQALELSRLLGIVIE